MLVVVLVYVYRARAINVKRVMCGEYGKHTVGSFVGGTVDGGGTVGGTVDGGGTVGGTVGSLIGETVDGRVTVGGIAG